MRARRPRGTPRGTGESSRERNEEAREGVGGAHSGADAGNRRSDKVALSRALAFTRVQLPVHVVYLVHGIPDFGGRSQRTQEHVGRRLRGPTGRAGPGVPPPQPKDRGRCCHPQQTR